MNDPENTSHTSTATTVFARPLVFGEAIVDQFAEGKKVLGGAPFNVAWNLRGLGFDPYFVSGVGCDAEGSLFQRKMATWEMDLRGLQLIDGKSTGKVLISVEQGEPSYEFAADQAYDNLHPIDHGSLDQKMGLLYHGSLVYRNKTSRATLQELIRSSELPRFVDVNIRQPHFDSDWIPELLDRATWVKVNTHELAFLSGMSVRDRHDVRAAVDRLRSRFGDATYFVTSGSQGAYAITQDEIEFAEACRPTRLVDSVGAGDAFSAATLGGILRSDPMAETLRRAVGFASRICGIEGATSEDRSLYQKVYS